MQETPRSEGANVVFECAGFLSATPKGLGYCHHSGTCHLGDETVCKIAVTDFAQASRGTEGFSHSLQIVRA